MKFRMVSEYDPKFNKVFYWTERKEWLGWWFVSGTLSSSQKEAEEHYARIVATPNAYEVKKKVIHES